MIKVLYIFIVSRIIYEKNIKKLKNYLKFKFLTLLEHVLELINHDQIVYTLFL